MPFAKCIAAGDVLFWLQKRTNDHLFEGRYSPTNAQGKREVHTVYAKTKEECEVLLEQMIAEVREQIKEEKRQMKLLTTAGR